MAFLYPGATAATVERFISLQRQAANLATSYAKLKDYRAYYAGEHPVMLSARQEEYLGAILTQSAHTVAFNLCKVVVDVLRERLAISGFTGADAAGQTLAAQVWQWWEAANMDLEAITVMRRALRDSAGYLIVDWDSEKGLPRWKANSKYDGNTGVTFHRDENDQPWMAVKYWRRDNILIPDYGTLRRTIYLPDRILKYREGGGPYGWTPIDPQEGAAVQFWTNTRREGGKPLGLACVEFLNPGGVSEIEAIIGLQNAINKLLLDLLAAGDATGFQMLVASYPGPLPSGAADDDAEVTDDVRIAPGRLLEVGDGATITNIPPGDLSQLLKALDAVIGFIGASTRTPQYYLRPFGGADVPSGEALKQLESALVSRAKERQTQFGGAWVDAMRVAARLWLAMGGRGIDAEAPLVPAWASPEIRNELYDTQVAAAEDALGVPREHLWQHRLGYSPEEVAEFKQASATAEAGKLAAILGSLNLGANNGNGGTATRGAGGNGAIG